jgi:RecB family endonuclease NucS
MRIVIANCSAVYTGRGDTKLNSAVRAIIIKSDGAVSIHPDTGNKPLNYMGKGNVFAEENIDGTVIWKFDTRKENLTLTLHEIISDSDHELDLDAEGLVRDGTENHLQEWLADNPEVIGSGFTLVEREFRTENGPVDLLMKDPEGNYLAVEIKRVAMLNTVGQVERYVNAMMETGLHGTVRGLIVALDIRPNTLKLAEKRGVECVVVDSAWKARNRS